MSKDKEKFNQALKNHIIFEEKIQKKIKRLNTCLVQQKEFLVKYGQEKFKVDCRTELEKIRRSRPALTSPQRQNIEINEDDDALLLAVDADACEKFSSSTNKSKSSSSDFEFSAKKQAEPVKCFVEITADSLDNLFSTLNTTLKRAKNFKIEIIPKDDSTCANTSRQSIDEDHFSSKKNCGLS